MAVLSQSRQQRDRLLSCLRMTMAEEALSVSVAETIHADWGQGSPGFWRTWLEAPPPQKA